MDDDSKTASNQMSDIVKLKQMLKRWRKQTISSEKETSRNRTASNIEKNKLLISRSSNNNLGSVNLLLKRRRLISFPDYTRGEMATSRIPKGFLAVHVGEEMKRFIIPTNYLHHEEFRSLLKQAEEEFGFRHEGVLRIPCDVTVFEGIVKMVDQSKNKAQFGGNQAFKFSSWINQRPTVCGSPAESCRTTAKSYRPKIPRCR